MDQDLKLRLIPREAYRFWPNQSITKRHSGRFFQRMIFKRQEFSDPEEEALMNLSLAVDSDRILSLRVVQLLEKPDMLRMIYAAEWDIPTAFTLLRQYIAWYDSVLTPIRQTGAFPHLPALNSGGCYTYGRDCFYRPILIFRPSRLHSFPIGEVLSCVTFLLDYIETYMMLPGQIENWVLILDMEQSQNATKLSILEFKAVVAPFMIAYACRLAAGFIWRINRSLWERLTAMLSPETSGKFTIIADGQGRSEFFKTINKTQLEARFGGSAADKETFWPLESVARATYSAETAVELGDYSSYQEYFPERSLSFGSESHISFSEDESPRAVRSVVVASSALIFDTETEEGPTVTRPIRVNRPSLSLPRDSIFPSPKKRSIVNIEAIESDGLGCYCLVHKPSNDCQLL